MKTKTPMLLPNRLREWRQVHGWTLSDVAERMKLSITTIARHETDNNGVTLLQLMEYGRLYNVSIEDLAPNGTNPNPTLVEILKLGTQLSATERDQLLRIAKAMQQPAPTERPKPRMRSRVIERR